MPHTYSLLFDISDNLFASNSIIEIGILSLIKGKTPISVSLSDSGCVGFLPNLKGK
jgi:hypothetical protein